MSSSTKIKRVVELKAGGTPAVDDALMWDDEGLPWVAIADMTRGSTVLSTDRKVSRAGLREKSLPVGNPGTLLFAMYASVGATSVLGIEASWNQAIVGMSPRHGRADPRFVRYWLEHLKPGLAAHFRSNTQDNLNAEQVGNLPFPVLDIHEQTAIADYLDRETARIDALIAAKRRMVELLEEHWQGVLESTIQQLMRRFGGERMKYACSEIKVGIVVTPSVWYSDSGTPAIRGLNVLPGRISMDDPVFLTREGHLLHRKSQLRTGDIVVVRTGKAGTAAVVPPELDGANCIDLVIVRPSDRSSSRFLEFVLNSDWMQKHVEEHSVGTIQSHFNVGAVTNVPIPRAPRQEQEVAVANLDATRSKRQKLGSFLEGQIRLLQERRRSLVARAVSGQIPAVEAA